LLIQVAESTKKVWEKEHRKNRKLENSAAKLIAIVVRNCMEDFHVKHLSDAQMKELNPIIRNAIYTALVQMRENPDGMGGYGQLYMPQYWEDCELLSI
jgi:hypothetical protein